MNHSHAQNSSCRANGNIPNTVVNVVTIIGWSLVFPADITECRLSIHFSRFLFILSIKMIASLTTTQVKAINQIIKDIEYGFQVRNNHIFTQSTASTTEYNTIAGCLYELN